MASVPIAPKGGTSCGTCSGTSRGTSRTTSCGTCASERSWTGAAPFRIGLFRIGHVGCGTTAASCGCTVGLTVRSSCPMIVCDPLHAFRNSDWCYVFHRCSSDCTRHRYVLARLSMRAVHPSSNEETGPVGRTLHPVTTSQSQPLGRPITYDATSFSAMQTRDNSLVVLVRCVLWSRCCALFADA